MKHNEQIISNGLEVIKKITPKKYFKSLKIYDENHDYELDSSGNPITDDDYKIETGLIAQEIMTIPDLKYLVSETEDKYEIIEDYKKDSNGNFILDEKGDKIKETREQLSLKGRYDLKYQDIFVYNIQATQELDRQQQADKAKIASLETKVASLESELAAIKAHLGL